MFFELEHTIELLTPTITHTGVSELNPLLTSHQVCHLDDNEIDFNGEHLTKLVSINHSHDDSDEQHQEQEDLFSTFDLPVLNELNRTDSTFDGIQIEKYLTQGSFTSVAMNTVDVSNSEDSTFYPVEDSNSSTQIWVGNECTVESQSPNEMNVPLTPPLSPRTSTKRRQLTTIERKIRKKDQNKTAAEKYRLKKRNEKCDLMTRHTELKSQNQELKFQLETVTFQLEQFKQLFVDVLQIPIPSNQTQ